ncbi:MAG: hypothetical protein JWN25_2919 [Verrucomicrobiales bacterium]|nr:hypothetical protein [Verrucomicrobiales bacterium]
MKTKLKFTKLVLAASLGSLIWAGCSTNNHQAFNSNDHSITAYPLSADVPVPVDQTKRRPDTHPELRRGAWDFTYSGTQQVVEAPNIQDAPPGTVDSPVLLGYEPEYRNAFAATQGDVINEAAGANSDRKSKKVIIRERHDDNLNY